MFPTKGSKAVLSGLLVALLVLSLFFVFTPKSGVSAQPNFLTVAVSGPQKLGVNEVGSYVASVNNSYSGNLTYSWSITPVDNNTVIVGDGASCSLTFVNATTDAYMLSVHVTDNVVGNSGSAALTVYDPYTSPGYKFDASTASASWIAQADGLGWFRIVKGLDGSIVSAYTSTNPSTTLNGALAQGGILAITNGAYTGASLVVPASAKIIAEPQVTGIKYASIASGAQIDEPAFNTCFGGYSSGSYTIVTGSSAVTGGATWYLAFNPSNMISYSSTDAGLVANNSVLAACNQGGGKVEIAAGNFIASTTVVPRSNVVITGQDNATVWQPAVGFYGYMFAYTASPILTSSYITHFAIDGKDRANGIFLNSTNNCHVDYMSWIHNIQGTGIELTYYAPPYFPNSINYNFVLNCTVNGIRYFHVADSEVIGNNVGWVGYHVLALDQSGSNRVSDNQLWWAGMALGGVGSGIENSGSDDVLATNNIIEGNYYDGILSSATGCHYDNNFLYANSQASNGTYYSIHISTYGSNQITNNRIIGVNHASGGAFDNTYDKAAIYEDLGTDYNIITGNDVSLDTNGTAHQLITWDATSGKHTIRNTNTNSGTPDSPSGYYILDTSQLPLDIYTITAAAGGAFSAPLYIDVPTNVTAIPLTWLGTATGNVYVGIYSTVSGLKTPVGGTLITSNGSSVAKSGTYRTQEITVTPTVLQPGLYWITVETSDTTSIMNAIVGLTYTSLTGYGFTQSYGALPTTYPAGYALDAAPITGVKTTAFGF